MSSCPLQVLTSRRKGLTSNFRIAAASSSKKSPFTSSQSLGCLWRDSTTAFHITSRKFYLKHDFLPLAVSANYLGSSVHILTWLKASYGLISQWRIVLWQMRARVNENVLALPHNANHLLHAHGKPYAHTWSSNPEI